MESNNGTSELIYKTKVESQIWKTDMVTKRNVGRDELGDWIDINTLYIYIHTHIYMITNKNRNSTQYFVMICMGKE